MLELVDYIEIFKVITVFQIVFVFIINLCLPLDVAIAVTKFRDFDSYKEDSEYKAIQILSYITGVYVYLFLYIVRPVNWVRIKMRKGYDESE